MHPVRPPRRRHPDGEPLGWPATVEQIEQGLDRCHPTNRDRVQADLERARRHEGPTLFDQIVEIIRDHGPGGGESEDGVALELQ